MWVGVDLGLGCEPRHYGLLGDEHAWKNRDVCGENARERERERESYKGGVSGAGQAGNGELEAHGRKWACIFFSTSTLFPLSNSTCEF